MEYCYRLRDASPDTWIFWLNASSAVRCEQECRKIADIVALNNWTDPSSSIITLFFQWLGSSDKRWLLVLDDIGSDDFLHTMSQGARTIWKELLLAQRSGGNILITSRNREVATRLTGKDGTLVVESMNETLARSLLGRKLGVKVTDIQTATHLVKELDRLPLAITLAASFIRSHIPGLSVSQYLTLIKKVDPRNIGLPSNGLNTDRDNVVPICIQKVWQISFDEIRSSFPSAMKLLFPMSFFSSDELPEKLFCETDKTNDNHADLSSQLARVSLSRRLQKEATSKLSSNANGQLNDSAAHVLSLYSFLRIRSDGSSKQFQMHRLIRLSTQSWLRTNGEHEFWKRQFIHNLYMKFPTGRFENWNECQVLFTHVQDTIAQRPIQTRNDKEFSLYRNSLTEWASLLHEAARFAWTKGRVDVGKVMAQKAMDARIGLFGKENEYTLSSLELIAMILSQEGKWKEAENIHVQVLGVCRRILAPDHTNTNTVMGNLASTYRRQGRSKEAEALELKVSIINNFLPCMMRGSDNIICR